MFVWPGSCLGYVYGIGLEGYKAKRNLRLLVKKVPSISNRLWALSRSEDTWLQDPGHGSLGDLDTEPVGATEIGGTVVE